MDGAVSSIKGLLQKAAKSPAKWKRKSKEFFLSTVFRDPSRPNRSSLDLSYITPQLVALQFHPRIEDSNQRMHLADWREFEEQYLGEVSWYLLSRHHEHLLVWNISDEAFNYAPLKHQVVDFSSLRNSVPSTVQDFWMSPHLKNLKLELILQLTYSIRSWLASHPENVAAVLCLSQSGLLLVVVISYLILSGEVDDIDDGVALITEASRWSIYLSPSQRRYLQYFKVLNSVKTVPNTGAARLETIFINTVPDCDGEGRCDPSLLVFCDGELLYSHRPRGSAYTSADGFMQFQVSVPLVGDVSCILQHVPPRSRGRSQGSASSMSPFRDEDEGEVVEVFSFAFHAGFVPRDGAFRIGKNQLDLNPSGVRISNDLYVEFTMDPVENVAEVPTWLSWVTSFSPTKRKYRGQSTTSSPKRTTGTASTSTSTVDGRSFVTASVGCGNDGGAGSIGEEESENWEDAVEGWEDNGESEECSPPGQGNGGKGVRRKLKGDDTFLNNSVEQGSVFGGGKEDSPVIGGGKSWRSQVVEDWSKSIEFATDFSDSTFPAAFGGGEGDVQPSATQLQAPPGAAPPPPPPPGGGPPPPPPPPGTRQRSGTRTLFWTKLPAKDVGKTIYASATPSAREANDGDDEDTPLDMSELEQFFKVDNSASKKAKVAEAEVAVGVLDHRRAKNVEIVLSRFRGRLGYRDIRRHLWETNLCDETTPLTLEDLVALYRALPPQDDLETVEKVVKGESIKGRKLDITKMGPAEQFIACLLEIPDLRPRMEVHMFACHFRDQVDDNAANALLLEKACREVFSSKRLAGVLEVVLTLGNQLNRGTRMGDAKGITLDSLLKLGDMRSTVVKSASLLHYLAFVVESKMPELADFETDLQSLEDASKLSLDHIMQGAKGIQNGMVSVKMEIAKAEVRDVGPLGGDPFVGKMREFCDGADLAMRNLTFLVERVKAAYDTTSKYLGQDPNHSEEWTRLLWTFVLNFRSARKRNKETKFDPQKQVGSTGGKGPAPVKEMGSTSKRGLTGEERSQNVKSSYYRMATPRLTKDSKP